MKFVTNLANFTYGNGIVQWLESNLIRGSFTYENDFGNTFLYSTDAENLPSIDSPHCLPTWIDLIEP